MRGPRVITCSRLALAGVLAFAAIAAGAAAYTIPNLYGGKDSTCFWSIGVINGGRLNIAYPDAGANYWGAGYTVPAGASLELKGEYPHARYASVESYNAFGVVTDALVDYQINPDPGSRNPFRTAVRRDTKRRAFTITLLDSSPAAPLSPDQRTGEPARNYVYTKPLGDTTGLHILLWRVYVPDKGSGLRGGVPLPHPVLRLANGTIQTGQQACNTLTSQQKRLSAVQLSALLVQESEYDKLRYQPGVPPWFPAKSPPVWRVQYNRAYLLALYDGPTYHPDIGTPTKAGQSGFFPNIDNQYARAAINRKLGKVVAFRGRMPTFPSTVGGEANMQQGTQLRYLSFCMNQSVLTTKVMGCIYDEQIPLHGHRQYLVVTTRPQDRPSNAIAKCGVAWLPWSAAGDGGKDHDFGWMQLRNMLPSPSFHHAIQNTMVPGDERRVMGSYLPTGSYYKTKQAFEKLGCPVK